MTARSCNPDDSAWACLGLCRLPHHDPRGTFIPASATFESARISRYVQRQTNETVLKEEFMSLLGRAAIKISGSRRIQSLLERNVETSQYLMGIGSGALVSTSGERAIFDIIRQRTEPPYCIFDVGSNKGQYLRLVHENMIGSNYSVHCFEPGRESFRQLVESSKGNEHTKLNNIALGNSKGGGVLHYDGVGSGLASLTKRRLDHFSIDFSKEESVELNTVDDYCSENGISHVHLLKIDVEGHELDVLTGAQQMFAAKSIDMATFEFGGCNIDTRTFFQDFWYFFKEVNFNVFRITSSGYLQHLESYSEIYEQFRTTNFVAESIS